MATVTWPLGGGHFRVLSPVLTRWYGGRLYSPSVSEPGTPAACPSPPCFSLRTACGSPTPADAPPEVEVAEPATVFTEIVPVVYMGAGNECAVRLDEEFDGEIVAE